MSRIALNAEAGQVAAELARPGIGPATRVRVIVEVVDTSDDLPMAAIAQSGGAFDWLAGEPDPYTDADLLARRT